MITSKTRVNACKLTGVKKLEWQHCWKFLPLEALATSALFCVGKSVQIKSSRSPYLWVSVSIANFSISLSFLKNFPTGSKIVVIRHTRCGYFQIFHGAIDFLITRLTEKVLFAQFVEAKLFLASLFELDYKRLQIRLHLSLGFLRLSHFCQSGSGLCRIFLCSSYSCLIVIIGRCLITALILLLRIIVVRLHFSSVMLFFYEFTLIC